MLNFAEQMYQIARNHNEEVNRQIQQATDELQDKKEIKYVTNSIINNDIKPVAHNGAFKYVVTSSYFKNIIKRTFGYDVEVFPIISIIEYQKAIIESLKQKGFQIEPIKNIDNDGNVSISTLGFTAKWDFSDKEEA